MFKSLVKVKKDMSMLMYLHIKTQKILTWNNVLNLWINKNKKFNKVFRDSLSKPSFNYMWKTVPLTKKTLHMPFVSMFLPNDKLPEEEDYTQYKKYITPKCNQTASFWNPSETTYLLIPCPRNRKNFSTLKYFNDQCSETQSLNFWKAAGEIAFDYRDAGEPVWINTHGTGIPYLHLRYDETYKYSCEMPGGFNKMNKITEKSILKWYKELL